jgi:hypothetical protein
VELCLPLLGACFLFVIPQGSAFALVVACSLSPSPKNLVILSEAKNPRILLLPLPVLSNQRQKRPGAPSIAHFAMGGM